MVFHANRLSARTGKNSVSEASRDLCVSSRTKYTVFNFPFVRVDCILFFIYYIF